MTIYVFNDDGIVESETYIETFNDGRKPIHACDWFYDGKMLTVTQYRNRDKNGNYYTTKHVVPGDWWIKNKTRERLIADLAIPPNAPRRVTIW